MKERKITERSVANGLYCGFSLCPETLKDNLYTVHIRRYMYVCFMQSTVSRNLRARSSFICLRALFLSARPQLFEHASRIFSSFLFNAQARRRIDGYMRNLCGSLVPRQCFAKAFYHSRAFPRQHNSCAIGGGRSVGNVKQTMRPAALSSCRLPKRQVQYQQIVSSPPFDPRSQQLDACG